MKLFYSKAADMEEWIKDQSYVSIRYNNEPRDWMVNMHGVLVGMSERGFREMCFANPFYFINYKVRGEDKWTVARYGRAIEDLHEELKESIKYSHGDYVEITEINMISKSVHDALLSKDRIMIPKIPRPCTY